MYIFFTFIFFFFYLIFIHNLKVKGFKLFQRKCKSFFILNIYCIQPNITIPSESNKHFLEKKKEKNAKKIAIFLYAPNKDALLLAKKKVPLSFMHEKKGSHAINFGQGQASICSCDFCQAKP